MSQTAFITTDEIRDKVLTLNFSMYLNSDIITLKSLTDLEKLIELVPRLDLIVIDEVCFSEKETNKILAFLKTKELFQPVITLTSRNNGYPGEITIPFSQNMKPLLKEVAKILGVTAVEMAGLKLAEYISFPISFFEYLPSSPCPVFTLRAKTHDILFSAKEKFQKEKFEVLIQEKIEKLFIMAKDRLIFTNFFTDHMDKKLKELKASGVEKLKETEKATIVTQAYIQELGIDETSVRMIKSCLASMKSLIQSTPDKNGLLGHLQKIISNTSSYNFTHSHLTAHLACYAIGKMSWGSDEQKEKIIFISFFHNLLLDDEKCKIYTNDMLEKSGLDVKIKDQINKHALDAAVLVQNFPKAPLGADELVKQHHGSRNGIGFPEQASASLSSLAIVFFIAEMLANKLLAKPFNKEAAFQDINQRIPKGPKAKSISDCLQQLDFKG